MQELVFAISTSTMTIKPFDLTVLVSIVGLMIAVIQLIGQFRHQQAESERQWRKDCESAAIERGQMLQGLRALELRLDRIEGYIAAKSDFT
jgi:hypothetical protein